MNCSAPGIGPSLSPGACLNSCPLSQWCYLTTSSSSNPVSSCPHSFPASRSFPMSWLFSSGGQSIGVSASVLPMHAGLCCAKSLQSCPTLCNPMECSLPGSAVHRIIQARILEWVVVPISRGSSQPRYQTQVACIEGGFLTIWATWEVPSNQYPGLISFRID